jgi:hypothetical protein
MGIERTSSGENILKVLGLSMTICLRMAPIDFMALTYIAR